MPPQTEEGEGGHDLLKFNLRENTVSEGMKRPLIVEEGRPHQIAQWPL